MAFWHSLISLLVFVVSVSVAVEVPVFLWGDLGRNTKHSALSSVPAEEFRRILKHELLEDPFTVVFIEETLSVEDFSRKIDEDTSFPYLESEAEDAAYLPIVKDPLDVLNKLAVSSQADHVKLTDNGLSADVSGGDRKFLFINLKDAKEGESREDLLRRHNDFMEDMFNKLQERYNKVVAIYTAHYPSWTVVEHSRVRRQAETKPKDTAAPAVTSLNFGGLKIYFQSATLSGGTGNATVLSGAVGDPASFVNATQMNSVITFNQDVKVTLNFETKAGYWYLNSASLNSPNSSAQTLYPSDAANQLFGYTSFSYRCSSDIRLQTKEAKPVNATETNPQHWTFTLHNSRLQPYFVNDSSSLQFGDMLNCTGFFTAPIWAGLFITFIMLAITFYGIMMMMDIKTMDRFDDPKGKTITINAAE